MDGIEATQLAGSVVHDLSIWSLFWQSDMIVKMVIVMLAFASIWCWAIILDKMFSLKSLSLKANHFEKSFWSGESLDRLYDKTIQRARDPMTRIFNAGMKEWRMAHEKGISSEKSHFSLQQRIEKAMSVTINREMDNLEKNMTFLATVGSTAPFIGLFGTVWGIMNSFTAIAGSNTTNLAVVAPGIAEALFATALGLVAAIPAVIAYNKFSSDIGRYCDRLEGFSSEFTSLLSRFLDEKGRQKKAEI